ncbi:hypothetical protein DV711_01800 [Motiliproteus coralliicola]|uniref:Uncharacterized protein n=1 Tax=Motiliproteus coralliicola TaxID=2283196 RepID=A0A369WTG3_9GAMM|nr:hypothetical protein [Motiliproteus coralliicola]RDE24349.1 hypothetical protein DV711_01800 [Motiliproteus coralliicola]
MKLSFRPLLFACLTLLCIQPLLVDTAQAYSYAAKGREPVMEGWLAISQALSNGTTDSAEQAMEDLRDELTWMESERNAPLVWPLDQAIREQDLQLAAATFTDAFISLIDLRLSDAAVELDNYQLAKVKVVKSGLFLDTLMNDPDLLGQQIKPQDKLDARQALDRCLEALGKPGLFGSGKTPANPELFEQAHARLIEILARYQN